MEQRAGDRRPNTARGRAAKVMNTAMAAAAGRTAGIWDGVASRPSRKKIRICIRLVSPSKKLTTGALFFTLELPRTMPTMYALR